MTLDSKRTKSGPQLVTQLFQYASDARQALDYGDQDWVSNAFKVAAIEIERLWRQVDCLTNGNAEQGCGHDHP